VSQCAHHTIRPVARSNIRPVAQYVLEHRKPSQPIYLAGGGVLPQTRVSGRNVEFLCYWPGGEENIFRRMIDPREIKADQFWVVYTTISTDKRAPLDLLLQQLRTVAQPTEEFTTGPAGAVLYHLRTMPRRNPLRPPRTDPRRCSRARPRDKLGRWTVVTSSPASITSGGTFNPKVRCWSGWPR
jgi:hypothetical protein